MDKVEQFYIELEKRRKPPSEDPFDNRITHCYLETEWKDKKHYFEVRGWTEVKGGALNVSVVNWTLCAGTATLYLHEGNINDYKILDDYPTS